MTLETVKATYDPQTRAVYIKCAKGKIDKTIALEINSVYYADIDKNGLVLGYEIIIPRLPND